MRLGEYWGAKSREPRKQGDPTGLGMERPGDGMNQTAALPCPECGGELAFTGLPNVAGPVYFRIYHCETCGYVRIPVEGERPEGWG